MMGRKVDDEECPQFVKFYFITMLGEDVKTDSALREENAPKFPEIFRGELKKRKKKEKG